MAACKKWCAILCVLGCVVATAAEEKKPTTRPATRPASQPAEGKWRSLFNGKDLTGWTCRPKGWQVKDGAIARERPSGFIWTKEKFGNFVLDVEFKISKRGNSGIFIRTASQRQWLHTGIEVQVLDSHGKKTPGKHDCGAIYDCLAPSSNASKPAGKWNRALITCKDNLIKVVLNGVPIINMDLNRWTQPHKNPDGSRNKFNKAYKDMPRVGFIGFQDHGNNVCYRKIRIKVLK